MDLNLLLFYQEVASRSCEGRDPKSVPLAALIGVGQTMVEHHVYR